MNVTMKKMELALLAGLFVLGSVGFVSCNDDDEVKPVPEDVENPLEKEVYYISGLVTAAGQALAGVQVATAGETAQTAADGSYTIELKAKKSYEVTFTKSGYLPITREVIFADNANKGTSIIVSQELTQEATPVVVKVDEATLVNASEDLSIDIPAGTLETEQSTSFTSYMPAPNPQIIKKEAEATQTGTAKTIVTQTALQSIVANPSVPLKKPVQLKVAAPATDGIVFTNVKHMQLVNGVWVDKGAAAYSNGSYQIQIEGAITSHQVVVETQVEITPKKEVLTKKTINNIGKTDAVKEKITYTEKKGWEIVSYGKALGTVEVVLEQAVIAQMGSKPGVTTLASSKEVAVSGDVNMEIALNQSVSERVVSVETNQGPKSVTVRSFTGVTVDVKTQQGNMDRQHNKK